MDWLGIDQSDIVRQTGHSRDWVSRRIGTNEKTGRPRKGNIYADEIEVFARALRVSPCVLVDDEELRQALKIQPLYGGGSKPLPSHDSSISPLERELAALTAVTPADELEEITTYLRMRNRLRETMKSTTDTR